MRLLPVLLLILVIGLLWRTARRAAAQRANPAPTPTPPQVMLACRHCGVHLPAADALHSANGGAYCCADHRSLGER